MDRTHILILLTLAIFITINPGSCRKNGKGPGAGNKHRKYRHSSNSMVKLGFSVETVLSTTSMDKLGNWDSVIFVSKDLDDWPELFKSHQTLVEDALKIDSSLQTGIGVYFPPGKIPYMIYSPTGPVNRDYDDVRRYEDAVTKAFTRAIKAGKKNILFVVPPSNQFKDALLVSLLAAFEVAYVPYEIREDLPVKSTKIEKIGLFALQNDAEDVLGKSVKLELGRIIARDIGGSDPERMTAAKTEEYLNEVFRGKNVKINVTSGHETFKEKFPLLAAVDRSANTVERHRGRLIYMEYEGEDVKSTYLLVGKGITYDTGGADLKVEGHMMGMHRDKCGAAAVAGLFMALSELMPKGLKVVAWLAMVRNSIGADSYVADEIVTSAAGVRVRVGFTDAEGRMVMADPLFYAKEQALKEVNPHLLTVATLTGHAIRAVGEGYSIVLDNGPAKKANFAKRIQEIGEDIAEPFEVSNIRREDYDFVAGRNEYEDLLQCNNAPSADTDRGHQFPAAFLIRASGLDKHGGDSDEPLKYSHMDIAGSSGPFPGIPSGAPIVALARYMGIV